MNYGAYTNLELLSLYGFHCGQNNPNDVIALDVPMKTTKTESSYQAKVIATSGALTFESERDLRLEYAVLASFKNSNNKHAQRAHTAAQRQSFSALASRGEQLSDASEINFLHRRSRRRRSSAALASRRRRTRLRRARGTLRTLETRRRYMEKNKISHRI